MRDINSRPAWAAASLRFPCCTRLALARHVSSLARDDSMRKNVVVGLICFSIEPPKPTQPSPNSINSYGHRRLAAGPIIQDLATSALPNRNAGRELLPARRSSSGSRADFCDHCLQREDRDRASRSGHPRCRSKQNPEAVSSSRQVGARLARHGSARPSVGLAASLNRPGWDAMTLFGCAPKRPLDYLGSAGLLWAINGGRLVELHRDWAVIDLPVNRSQRHLLPSKCRCGQNQFALGQARLARGSPLRLGGRSLAKLAVPRGHRCPLAKSLLRD
jgi:hypothetical protein